PNVRIGQVGARSQRLEGRPSALIFHRSGLGSQLHPVASAEQEPVTGGVANLAERLERGDGLSKVSEWAGCLTVKVKRFTNPAHQLGVQQPLVHMREDAAI